MKTCWKVQRAFFFYFNVVISKLDKFFLSRHTSNLRIKLNPLQNLDNKMKEISYHSMSSIYLVSKTPEMGFLCWDEISFWSRIKSFGIDKSYRSRLKFFMLQ
jgi:hypothetical protein